jgi:hypothetical protein
MLISFENYFFLNFQLNKHSLHFENQKTQNKLNLCFNCQNLRF